MQNALKKETAPVIRTLHNANIRTVMITGFKQFDLKNFVFLINIFLGDNLFTAISVARNCDMVNAQSKVLLVNLETENNSEIPKIFIENVEATDDHSEAIVNLASNVNIVLHFFVFFSVTNNFNCRKFISQWMEKPGLNSEPIIRI